TESLIPDRTGVDSEHFHPNIFPRTKYNSTSKKELAVFCKNFGISDEIRIFAAARFVITDKQKYN
ncbi:MAG: hypothetical protein LBK07_01425, partial [Tannerella sp.]|nr:hypothetical protein [Tannerella sp.]